MGSFSQAVPPIAPYKGKMSGAVVSESFEQVKDKIDETHRQSSQNMESCSRIEDDLNELRSQVNKMNNMLMKIMAALKIESKEDKPADSKADEDC